ncbi:vanadium-dependent haloperoxidase [Nocardioides humilatus]|nr:vanadium-dependent haloperoxidase [Nocardioides humilatus]
MQPDRPNWTRRGFLGLAGISAAGAASATWLPVPASASSDPDVVRGDAAHAWLRAVYDRVWHEGVGTPTGAARIYCAVAVGLYESVAPFSDNLRSLVGQLTDLRPLPQPPRGRTDPACVIASALRTLTDYLFRGAPSGPTDPIAAVYDRQVRLRRAAGVPAGVVSASLDHGSRVGRDLVAWVSSDGYAGSLRPYTPPIGPSRWRPSPPNYGEPIGAYFSEVRPMVLQRADEVKPVRYVPFSTAEGSAFWDQANATYQTGLALTQAQRETAMFWRDNPHTSGLPSGHWMQITRQVCEQRRLSLARSVEAYARVGVALHDAFLNCWTWKYRYNLIRPVDYVHDHIDPSWATWVATPPFPEYTSGHSVASAAAATVLTDLLGPIRFTDVNTIPEWGTRVFRNFRVAAEEAAISRQYGGIHYPMAIQFGMDQGDAIGTLVVNRLQTSV